MEGAKAEIDYNRTILALNYLDNGFIRRGLPGTFLKLFGEPSDLRLLVAFHIVSAVFLAVPLVLLVSRLFERGAYGTASLATLILVASPQLFWAWSSDIGRSDMLVCGLLAWSAIAVLSGRLTAAVVLLGIGTLVHETTVIYGIPLLAALAWGSALSGRYDSKAMFGPVALLAVALAALVFMQIVFAPSGDAIASNLARRIPQSYARDVGIYAMTAGSRSFETFLCRNLRLNHHYWPAVAFSVVYLAGYATIFGFRGRRDLVWLSAAVFLPFAILSAFTSDTGRWLSFSVMTIWLLAVGLQLSRDTISRPIGGVPTIAVSLALFFAMGPASYAYPAEQTPKLSELFGFGPPPDWDRWVEKCDPGWRQAIGLPNSSSGAGGGSVPKTPTGGSVPPP